MVNRTPSFLRVVLVEITFLQCQGPRWDANLSKIVILRYAACRFQIVRFCNVGGAFGWPNWSRSLANHTSSFLHLAFFEINSFAISRAKMGGQMDHNRNI